MSEELRDAPCGNLAVPDSTSLLAKAVVARMQTSVLSGVGCDKHGSVYAGL